MTLRPQKLKNGRRLIEWCDFTWPLMGGCEHRCRWNMPNGVVARCYAEAVAEGPAAPAYPQGFEHHYFREKNLDDPQKVKQPAFIFVDSMADMFGSWVPEEHIELALKAMAAAPQHTFQTLTKNAPRLPVFADRIPANVWVGASMPPSSFRGAELNLKQQRRFLLHTLSVLGQMRKGGHFVWMSFEPMSFEASIELVDSNVVLDWAVIGAASNGKTYYQPDPAHIESLLTVLDNDETPVFFKGNLSWDPHRENRPAVGTRGKGPF